jgi:SanA protein
MKERYFWPEKRNEAFGYNAEDVNKYAGLKTNLREYLQS